MATPTQDPPILIIGAGLAGLSAALRLARAGRQVEILEASDAHGGCCSTVRLDGFTFNNGAVYVAVPSLLRTAFARLGLDLDTSVPMSPIRHPFESHLEDGSVVHLEHAETSRVVGTRGVERTAELRAGLSELQRTWRPVYRTLIDDLLPQETSAWSSLIKLGRHLPKLRGDVASLIGRTFGDPGLRAAVGSLLLYTGQPASRLPASQIIGLLALLEEGFHLPTGGMGALSDALLRHALAAGVNLRLGQRVVRIEASGGAVTGVRLANGERIGASHVVATLSGFAATTLLAPQDSVPRRLARTARSAPLSHRAIAIQIGGTLPEGPEAFIVNHVPSLERQALMHAQAAAAARWPSYTVPTRARPELAPRGKSVVECFAPAAGIESASAWTRQMTEAAVGRHVEGLQQRLPGLCIETMRVIDPAEFQAERRLHEGALYGIAPGALPHRFFPHRTGIDGLFLAGQTTYPGYGVAPAMLSGIQSAEALLGRRKGGSTNRSTRRDTP